MNLKASTRLIFSICLLFFTVNAIAQGGGSVSGKLVDATSGQVLDFATVALVRKADNKPVKSMQTDMQGNFKLTGIDNGVYQLRATFVGYLAFMKDSISIHGNAVNLGNIRMRQSRGVIKEVTVTAQRSQIQLSTDKKVFTADQSLVSQGGSATDLLSNVPSVQVDVDGNVSLRGSTNVRVLINGKPSTLTGGDLSDILQSIPASSIETIEVITNPSSKYEAEGQSGIINIVLKKNASLGLTGSASGTIGTQHTYNGNLSLAYQNKKINIYGNYSYRTADRIGNGFLNKTITDSAGTTQTNQLNNQTFKFGGHNIRSGIDFNFNPKTTLSFTDNINIRSRDRFQTGGMNIYKGGVPFETQSQDDHTNSHGLSTDFNLDFDHKFKKPQEELTASAGISLGRDKSNDYLDNPQTFYNPPAYLPSLQTDNTLSKNRNITLQADYTLPLKNGKIEAGYRTTINHEDNNYVADTLNYITNVLNYDPLISNHFLYNENVNAVYGNYQHQFGSFGIQGGLRLEDAHVRNTLIDSTEIKHRQDYFRVYPTLFLTEKLSENQTLQLSYSRRVTRPRDRQISPFLDRSNTSAYQQGNPDLKPEDTHSVELSYINYWKALTLTSSIYYRLTNDNIQQITTPYTRVHPDTTITIFQNLKSATNAGYELIAKLTATRALDLTGNVNVYYRYIAGDPALDLATTSGWSWNGNLTANVKATKQLGFQIRADYQSRQVVAQGYMKAMYGVDGGVRYDITKRLSLSGNVRDIFNTRKFSSVIAYGANNIDVDQVSQRRFATRTGTFTISYRFGNNGMNQRQRKKQDQNPDQQNQDIPDEMQPNNNNGTGAPGQTPTGGSRPPQGNGRGTGN